MSHADKIHILSRAVIIDKNHLLLCKTLDLPVNFYFLPGGHVEHEESAEAAVKRELLEETGASSTIKRFLGCLEHSFEPGYNSICHNHEYNFFFEVEAACLKLNKPLCRMESHLDLSWVSFPEIGCIDLRPKPLKHLLPEWLKSFHERGFQSAMSF